MSRLAPPQGPDLFTSADVQQAMANVEAAETQRAMAARRAKLAPIGETTVRRQRLKETTLQALEAEVALARVAKGCDQ